MRIHRKLWIQNFGPIPKDEEGRSYEIHHIDGNQENNSLENLKCVSIVEHYLIHLNQGDIGACIMIGKRIGLPSDYLSMIQTGTKRPGIGGVKKGQTPWNKGKKNCFSKETIEHFSNIRKGKCWGPTKLTKEIVKEIRQIYKSEPKLKNYFPDIKPSKGNKGKYPLYHTAFANTYSDIYNITPTQIVNIVLNKAWKDV